MNQTIASAPGASLLPDTTDFFTAGHLVLIVALALVVIAGLIWGVRSARARRRGEREVAAYNRELKREAGETRAEPDRRGGGDRRQVAPLIDDDEPPIAPVEPEVANAPTELLFGKIPDASARFASNDSTVPDASAAPVETPPGGSPADRPVTQLKGLGPKLAAKLNELGITTVGQLAALTDDEAADLDARLGPFTGRMSRDRWQEQARFLAAGDYKGFEAVFGRL